MKPWLRGIAALSAGLMFFPVEVPCGAPGATCATAPAPGENTYSVSVALEPVVVYLLELALPATDIPVEYGRISRTYLLQQSVPLEAPPQ